MWTTPAAVWTTETVSDLLWTMWTTVDHGPQTLARAR